MKIVHLIPLVIIALAACQQPVSPKSDTESHLAPVAVEEVLQQEAIQPEKLAPETSKISKPATVAPEVINSAETVAKESVVEKKEVQPAVTEEELTKEVVKQPIPEAVKISDSVIEPADVKTVLGNVKMGAKLTKGKCGACHHFDKDRKKVGPTLMGIYNRAPVIDGVPYAVWDSAALDAWLTNPKAIKPKTKMGFRGVSDKAKRDDIIAYLKTL